MARPVASGTPDRPTQYQQPRRRTALAAVAAGLPLAVLAGAIAIHSAGYREVASPAPVTLRHLPVQASCEECHRSSFPYEVADVRCERCHDPRVTGRMGFDAHAAWVPVSQPSAAGDTPGACVDCHVEHRGVEASLRDVPAAECARCHAFTTLDGHPPFAPVVAGRDSGRGLRFSHARHLDEVQRTLGRGCEACHRSTVDLAGFEPVSFDRQCAVCHLKDGVLPLMTDPVPEALVSEPAAAAGGVMIRRPGRNTVVVSGLNHRDPWVLQNARQLNRGMDGDTEVAERAALEARIAALERARVSSLPDVLTADLPSRLAAIAAAPASTGDARLAPGRVGSADEAGTARMFDRLTLEVERRGAGTPAPVSLAASLSDERALELAIVTARARLATLVDRQSAPALDAAARAARADALSSILAPCLMCHETRGGREIAPVDVNARRLIHARFSHAPHVIQSSCETCHTTIASSSAAADLNVPGLDSCQTCHSTGRAPFTCTLCHRYHPSVDVAFAPARLGGGPESRR